MQSLQWSFVFMSSTFGHWRILERLNKWKNTIRGWFSSVLDCPTWSEAMNSSLCDTLYSPYLFSTLADLNFHYLTEEGVEKAGFHFSTGLPLHLTFEILTVVWVCWGCRNKTWTGEEPNLVRNICVQGEFQTCNRPAGQDVITPTSCLWRSPEEGHHIFWSKSCVFQNIC